MIKTIGLALLEKGHPNAVALAVPEGPILTYSELAGEVEQVTRILSTALDTETTERATIAISLPNSVEFIVCFMAAATVGIAAPMNPTYTKDEFLFYLQDSNAKAVVIPPDEKTCRAVAQELGVQVIEASFQRQMILRGDNGELAPDKRTPFPTPDTDDVALLLHTSGTTSKPKGVPLRHVNIMVSVGNIVDSYRLTEEDKSLIVMPLFHVHGLIGATLSSLYSGGTTIVPPRFSASSFWRYASEYKATWYSAVPTIHQILLARQEHPTRNFRFIRSCSSALSASVLAKLEQRFAAPVLEAYGMTEAAHQMSTNPLPPAARRPGTVGTPTGVKVAIMDNDSNSLQPIGMKGEVVIRGPSVMQGYLNNPEATEAAMADGWFRTGDQGVVDLDGYLTLTGRIKELINRGGEKISPLEVDSALLNHPAVAEAVTFAAGDPHYGECVQAAVVLCNDATVDEIRAFCAERLAHFKVPDIIYCAESLPRTATGKIQRRIVADHFLKG